MIHLWNPHQNKLIKEYVGHSSEVLDISICSDNAKFASVGGDRSAFLFDVLTARILRKFSGHSQRINCCSFNLDGTVLATGSYDSTVRLWDCKSQNRLPIQILEEPKDSVSSIEIQGYEILVGSVDGHIRNYDIRTGSLLDDSVSVPVTSVRFSRDNNSYLASCLDNAIRLIDKPSGNVLNEYIGHTNQSYKIESAFAMNDSTVVSGSEDSVVYFWDLIDAKVIHTLKGHSAAVCSVSMHPTDPALLTSSVDGTIVLWKQ